MAGDEDEPQQVVSDFVVERRSEVWNLILFCLEVASDLDMFLSPHPVTPEEIDGAMFGGRHEPGPRILWNAFVRPLLERGHERVLREIFSSADVARHARQRRDESGRFDTPD